MQINQNIIKAPAVDNLNDLKNIIKSLEYNSIPYSYIDKRHLKNLLENKKLSKENYDIICNWKIEQDIHDNKGDLQSIVSLMKSLGIIITEKIQRDDLEQPLSFSGPMLNSFISKSVDAVKLTEIGQVLCNLLEETNAESLVEYDNLLFWRFLHSNITHNFQKLIEDNDSYNKGVDFVLQKIEMDSRSANYFLKWTSYFELLGIGSKLLIQNKVAKKIIFCIIFELNKLECGTYGIQKLSNHVSKELDFSNNLINFFLIFEIILRHIQLSNEDKKALEGTTSSRGERSLPNFPNVTMLKINHKINFNSIMSHVSNSELATIWNIGTKP